MKELCFVTCSIIFLLTTLNIFPQVAKASKPSLISNSKSDSLDTLQQKNKGEEILAKFSGNNIMNTKPFTTNSAWEVHWDFNGEIFQLYLQSPEQELWEVLANQSGSGSGSSYYPKRGEYYFKVNAIGNWKIKVIEVK